MADGKINFIGNLLAPKPELNGNIQGAGAHIARADEGSSREFEKKHGTDWFANAVNTQLA